VNFDFAYGYAQTYVAKGFHQFCDCKIARYGASRTSPPTDFYFVPHRMGDHWSPEKTNGKNKRDGGEPHSLVKP
jgi:hypothetical protein